jgi:hypothetical protein
MARSPKSDWLIRGSRTFDVPSVEQRVLGRGAFRSGSSMHWTPRTRRPPTPGGPATEWPRRVPTAIQR